MGALLSIYEFDGRDSIVATVALITPSRQDCRGLGLSLTLEALPRIPYNSSVIHLN